MLAERIDPRDILFAFAAVAAGYGVYGASQLYIQNAIPRIEDHYGRIDVGVYTPEGDHAYFYYDRYGGKITHRFDQETYCETSVNGGYEYCTPFSQMSPTNSEQAKEVLIDACITAQMTGHMDFTKKYCPQNLHFD